jgi:hypothetical protein
MTHRQFEMLSVAGLNMITPPPASHRARAAAPRLWSLTESIEQRLQQLPVFRSLGDHVVFLMRRRTERGDGMREDEETLR